MKMYKLALIGYGNWGETLLRYLDRFFDVKYIFGRSLNNEGRFINDLNTVFASDIDAVMIATPIGTHYNIVKRALNCDKHIFCEKPLTTNPALARELEVIVNQKQLHLVTNYTYTFSKRLQNVRDNMIGKKGIGSLKSIRLEMKRMIKGDKFGVYWELASQMLAILDMFIDIRTLRFFKVDASTEEKGTVVFKGNINGSIFVDSVSMSKETEVVFDGDLGQIMLNHLHDAENNLTYAMEYFRDVLDGKIENKMHIARVLSVTNVLSRLSKT